MLWPAVPAVENAPRKDENPRDNDQEAKNDILE